MGLRSASSAINVYKACLFYLKIDALPEVVKAVEGKVYVFVDGGIRHGTDVLKALALGARAVFIGRPVVWGLAYQVSRTIIFVPKTQSLLPKDYL